MADAWDPAWAMVAGWPVPGVAAGGPAGTDPAARSLGCPFIRIDGQVGSTRVVADRIHRFQTDPTCRVALVSIQSGGAGIELFAANHVIFCELPFNGDDLIQAEGRAARIGQVRDVHVTYLMMKNSVEEQVWRIVSSKLAYMAKIIDNKPVDHQVDQGR